eukprot:CAMPEP_0119417060 /NCGR_PEP_ID=MMETSP1335-20130426/14786_1 /TAXON_ID=259385 /ORGANISM="Chrysoculter rhomboideus, Strain RCC1486" /LENGTH=159 /DNA_ID=CAMNT_0007442215 /DNA_START=18 /DNA_END=497 /DNA_ORIENTATION=+
MSRRACTGLCVTTFLALPRTAHANLLEGSSGFSSNGSEEALGSGVVSAAKTLGVRPRQSQSDVPMDDLTKRLLEQTAQNKERNDAIVRRRTILNSEGARIFPGDGVTVFFGGEPAEISMDEYQALLDEGRLVKGSRDVKPKADADAQVVQRAQNDSGSG